MIFNNVFNLWRLVSTSIHSMPTERDSEVDGPVLQYFDTNYILTVIYQNKTMLKLKPSREIDLYRKNIARG